MFDIVLSAPLSVFVSLAALTGVTIHDTKLDKLTISAMSAATVVAAADVVHKFNTDAHTHVERISLKGNAPRIMPRDDHKKHMLQKAMPKGAHRYDGYALPLA